MNKSKQPLSKPLLLLISGASGSGKSTLSKKIVESLGLFHIERDKLKFGVEFTTRSPPEDRIHTVIPRYFKAIEQMLQLGVSCIADGTHYPGNTEMQLARYKNMATVINIHCNARNSEYRKQAWRDDLKERVKQNDETLIEYEPDYFPPLKTKLDDPSSRPIEHGFEVLEIDTSNGYEPDLEYVLEWINTRAT